MLLVLTTLVFLSTLWLVGVVAIRTLEESGAKIAAALAGRPACNERATILELRLRQPGKPVNSGPQLRAAA